MSITVSATQLVTGALHEIGVLAANEAPNANDAAWGLQLLNELVDQWTIEQLTTLVQVRNVYSLVSGKGGPSNPYTIGPGGNFDTTPAARPDLIREATLSLAGSPAVEIPLGIITDVMHAAIQIKELSTQLNQYLYYRRTVPLGQIELWPVPNTSANSLVLYTDLLVPSFATLNTTYVAPPGYAKALRLNLGRELISSFAIPAERGQRVEMRAEEALIHLKEANANAKMADLRLDPAFTSSTPRANTYNIFSDSGSN
jgi:hypothetical protein